MLLESEISAIDRPYLQRLASGKPWTGRRVLAALVVTFGIVFAVNFTLIYLALTTKTMPNVTTSAASTLRPVHGLPLARRCK